MKLNRLISRNFRRNGINNDLHHILYIIILYHIISRVVEYVFKFRKDLTKVSHRDFKGLDTDKRIPRKEKDYRDKWSTSSSAALRKTCSPQFKLFNVCIGWFFSLQHCSFYNAWLQLSEKHVELIISYQGFSTIVFLLAIASRTFCTFIP